MAEYKLDTYINGRNHRVLQITGPYSGSVTAIQVLRSFSPVDSQSNDDWEILGYLDEGTCIYVDDERLPWNKARDVYYKMRVYNGEEFEDTDVVAAGRYSDKNSSGAIKGLINAINVEMKESGRSGYLLKARHWGKKCTKCRDFGTGRSVNGQCPECFGTGYVGGYYEALPLDIIDNAPSRQQGRSKEDYIESEAMQARCVANPIILRGDIWVSCNNNDRYFIDQCTPSSLYKGIPVVYTLVLKKINQSDVVFEKNVENIIEDSFINWEVVGK